MAVSYLRSLGVSIVGYYPYGHAIDIVGFLKLPAPFHLPLKIVAEIAKGSVTLDAIDGFSKLAKSSLADRMLMLASLELTELDPETKKKLESEGIELIGKKDIAAFSKTTTQKQAKQEYERIQDDVSPIKLIKGLPTFAKQVVPEDIQRKVGEPKLAAWQLLEEAVYCLFLYGLNYSVRQLGKEALFKNEPEGVVTTSGTNHFGLIYDCKSSATTYAMTADDERTYMGYITKKKMEVASLDHCELKYFIIISPDFSGDMELRRENILKETQVILSLFRAETLRKFGLWVFSLPPDLKTLIDMRDILTKEVVVSDRTIDNYIKSFDEKYKKRY